MLFIKELQNAPWTPVIFHIPKLSDISIFNSSENKGCTWNTCENQNVFILVAFIPLMYRYETSFTLKVVFSLAICVVSFHCLYKVEGYYACVAKL